MPASKAKGGAPTPAARLRQGLAGAVMAAAAWVLFGQLGLALKLDPWAGVLPALGVGFALGLAGAAGLLWLTVVAGVIGVTAATATPDLARQFTRRHIRDDALPTGGVQAVVVLSAFLTTDGQLDHVAADRLLAGLSLVKKLGAPLLVTTRFRHPDDPGITTDGDQGRLVALVASGARWIVTPEVFDTRDEARETAAIAKREGFTRIALVTSPMHTRRACAVFEAEGLAVTCVAATARDGAFRALKTPSERLRAVRLGVYESVAGVWYRLRGWL